MNTYFRSARHVLLCGPIMLLALVSSASAARYGAVSGSTDFSYRVAFETVQGHSGTLAASADFDPANLRAAQGTVSVKAASLSTGNGLQERHMRGALGAEAHPDIVFALNGVAGSALSEGQTLSTLGSGTLTLKGVTKPLSVPLKLTLNSGRVKVATQFKFNPHDYGVNYLGGADSIALNVGFVLAPR